MEKNPCWKESCQLECATYMKQLLGLRQIQQLLQSLPKDASLRHFHSNTKKTEPQHQTK